MSVEYNHLEDLPTDVVEYLKNKGIRVQGFENRSLWNLKGVEQMYAKCSPIRAILNEKRNAASNARVKLYKVSKDGEDAEVFEHDLLTLLRNPNPFQDFGTWLAQRMIYQDLYSRTYIRAVEGRNIGFGSPKALWNLRPDKVQIQKASGQSIDETRLFEFQDIITHFQYQSLEGLQNLTPDEVLFFSDFLFDYEKDTSDVKSIEESAKNLMAILESRGEIIKHRGALGMISPDVAADDTGARLNIPSGKIDLLSQIKKVYGLLRGQSSIMLPDYPVKWQKMSMSMAELRLSESQKDEVNACCDVLSVPRELFDPSTTFNNKEDARKKLYQDVVIPFCEGDIERLNAKMKIREQGMYFKVDFSHLPIFQEDEKDKEAALKVKTDRLISLFDKGLIKDIDVQNELGYVPNKTPKQ
jgi:hypothetical protein